MMKQLKKKIKEGRKKKNLTEYEINELEEQLYDMEEAAAVAGTSS